MSLKTDKISSQYNITVPKLINRTKRKIVFYSVIGDYNKLDYSKCWSKIWAFINTKKLFGMRMEFLGLYYDDPRFVPADECHFEACVTINKEAEDGEEIKTKEIEGGKYLMFHYTGCYDDFAKVHNIIYNEYLVNTDYKLRNSPLIEKYLNNAEKVESKKLRTEIYIPIE
ncbi:MAG: GyrI-like domain-containing protein [Bacteroidales bacterium]|nr:GyrI-like domain-containing protein [Bacteroidales bacterium]